MAISSFCGKRSSGRKKRKKDGSIYVYKSMRICVCVCRVRESPAIILLWV